MLCAQVYNGIRGCPKTSSRGTSAIVLVIIGSTYDGGSIHLATQAGMKCAVYTITIVGAAVMWYTH